MTPCQAIFQKYNIKYVLLNGGNGTMDTCGRSTQPASPSGVTVVGIPKTIDNDILRLQTTHLDTAVRQDTSQRPPQRLVWM